MNEKMAAMLDFYWK